MKFDFYIPKKLEGLSPMIWEQREECSKNWRMLPDGHLDLIFKFDEPWTVYSEVYTSKSYNPTKQFCFLSGLNTKPIDVSFSRMHVMGVRLNTIAVKLIFGIPCSELVNWAIDGEDILSKEVGMIENTIQELPGFYARAFWLENYIHSIIKNSTDFNVAIRISKLLDQIANCRITGQPFDICKLTGYSRMHTFRIFKDWFGLSPSQAIAMKQFLSALEHMHSEPESLTQVALANGYYDQAHFIHVFKQYAEMTPRKYLQNRTDIVGQLPFSMK